MTTDAPRQTNLELILERLYAGALQALPEPLHRRWAADMMVTFAERLREATEKGGAGGALGFGSRELAAIAVVALQSRVGRATGRVHRAHDAQDGSDVWRTDPVPALFFIEEDHRPLKIAAVGALACHFALFLVVFPEMASTESLVPEPRQVVPLVNYHPPTAPPRTKTRLPVNKDAPPKPIPDPTPRAPEPVYERVAISTYGWTEAEPSTDFEVAAPAAEPFAVAPPAATPPAPPERLRVGSLLEVPILLERVAPEYPEIAVRARRECTVILEAVIGKLGDMIDVKPLRHCGLGLDEAAIEAVRQWKYVPTMLNGRPVEVISTVTVRFELR